MLRSEESGSNPAPIQMTAEELKYIRPVDVFFEIPVAMYDLSSKSQACCEESSWIQLYPLVAVDYWRNVWQKFEAVREFRLELPIP